MWSNWSESAKTSLTHALEKTGDVISKAATQAGKQAAQKSRGSATASDTTPPDLAAEGEPGDNSNSSSTKPSTTAPPDEQAFTEKRNELLGSIQAGWSSVVQQTVAGLQTAQHVVEEQQHRLQEKLQQARLQAYKRDASLPLDVVALKDAQVVYMTDRLITMSHPGLASATNPEISGPRKLAAVGHLLEKRHAGRYMVWNISEVDYDTRILDNQVLTYSFPGSPSPPLGLLLKLLMSMEAWLRADPSNVAVVHCLTGKGRTSTVLAAFLCWMGEAGFGDIYQALDYIAACKQISVAELTIPSQRRYASYFKNMLDGVRPSQPPLLLKRIIMSQAPKYAKGPPRDKDKEKDAMTTTTTTASSPLTAAASVVTPTDDPTQWMGCAPYLQLFKAGQLLYTTPACLHFQQADHELPFCQVADGAVPFNINQVVQGDILVRCRHLAGTGKRKQRVSMFRAAFHTGYVPPTVLRLKKSELDGACNDDRYADDFFLDLIFEAVDAEEASQLLQQQEAQMAQQLQQLQSEPMQLTTTASESDTVAAGTAATKVDGATPASTTVTASMYDSMLHRDSRFWDVIATRRQEQAQAAAQKQDDSEKAKKKYDASMYGPTIGRRRDFDKPKKEGDGNKDGTAATPKQRKALETFSIGGELDFLPTKNEAVTKPKPKVPKKDSLMEALMGALSEGDNSGSQESDVEVVIFDDGGDSEPFSTASSATTDEKAGASDTATMLTNNETTTTDSDKNKDTSTTTQSEKAETTTAPADQQKPGADKNDMEALLADANLNLGDDMDALLAQAGDDAGGGTDADLLDFDDDDLEDLENFLSPSSK